MIRFALLSLLSLTANVLIGLEKTPRYMLQYFRCLC